MNLKNTALYELRRANFALLPSGLSDYESRVLILSLIEVVLEHQQAIADLTKRLDAQEGDGK